MSDCDYGVMTARMPHCPLTCCSGMDLPREMYLPSCCSASAESPSYLPSTCSTAYHQFRPNYTPMQPSTCHTVGWDGYRQYQTRMETPMRSPTGPSSLYPVTQSSHTSSASVGLPPYKFTTSADLPALVPDSTFTHPPGAMICSDQTIIGAADHKTNDNKVKLEDFHSLRAEGLQPPEYRSRLKHRLPRRDRLNFTDFQLMRLEESFSEKKYIIGADRKSLADELGISEIQVKNWYQNRRTRWKRERKPDSK